MDYPKSVPNVGLVNGKFVDEDAAQGTVGSLIPSSWGNAVTDEILSVQEAAGIEPDEENHGQLLDSIRVLAAPIVGSMRNGRIYNPGLTSSITFTADQVVVANALSGKHYRLSNVNKTLNIATTGMGGMDTGTSPPSAWVAVYLAFNPTTGESGLVGFNTGNAVAPEIYAGTHMSAGYTATALVSVLVTNTSGQIKPLSQKDRKVVFPGIGVFNSSADNASFQPINLVGVVPPNAKTAGGYGDAALTVGGTINFAFAADAAGMGSQTFNSSCAAAYGHSLIWTDVPLAEKQTVYVYRSATLNGSGVRQYMAYCSSYTF